MPPGGALAPDDPSLAGLFCDTCGRDITDIADEDFFKPAEQALQRGYLSGRCQRHPPEDAQLFERVHVGGDDTLTEEA